MAVIDFILTFMFMTKKTLASAGQLTDHQLGLDLSIWEYESSHPLNALQYLSWSLSPTIEPQMCCP